MQTHHLTAYLATTLFFFLYLEETAHLVEKGEAKIFQFLNIGTEHLR